MGLDEYREIIHRCFRCGFCKLTTDYNWRGFNCPEYNKFRLESYSPGGMLWLSYAAFVTGELKPDNHLAEILYSCSMCKNCAQSCKFKFGDMVTEMLRKTREEIVEKHPELVPAVVQKFLKNVYRYGNPYGVNSSEFKSIEKIPGVERYSNQEYLLYLSPISYIEPSAYESAHSLAEVLVKLKISFGIIGPDEICDGNEVLMLGDSALFDYVKEKNLEQFKKMNVKKIITFSPHSYNAMKNYYSMDEIEVFHYTQIIYDFLNKGKIKFNRGLNKRITYHDPCFLGRYNGIYEEPREILRSIPGIDFVEMPRNREKAFCCGGGGGNFYTDMIGPGENAPSRVRVREAEETGAEIIAVACPVCKLMLENGAQGEDSKLEIKDISAILLELL